MTIELEPDRVNHRARSARQPTVRDRATVDRPADAALGWLLIAVLTLAPIPLGSNRPALWAIWAAAIGALAMGYATALLLMRVPTRLPAMRFWPELAAFCLLLGWLIVQQLPLGDWLPGVLPAAPTIGTFPRSISLDPGSTELSALTFATYGLFALLVMQAGADRQLARGMLMAMFFVVAAFALYGLVSLVALGDTLLGFEKLSYKGAVTGTFVNRNSFATFLAAGLAIGVPLLLDGTTPRRLAQPRTWVLPALVVLGLLFIVAALLATGSRMGATAGAVGIIVTAVLSLLGPGKSPARWWLLGLFVFGVIAVATLYGATTLERAIVTDDATGREELFRQVWSAVLQRPLTGYGGGSFAAVFPAFQHAPLGSNDLVWDKAHSTYLALWFELGLVGGSIPLLIVATLLFRAMRRLGDPSSRSISIAAIGVTVVFALHSVVDFSAEIMANAMLFTAILALGASRGVGDK